MSWAILNAQMVDVEKACISADDRGLLMGDGIFETLRAYRGEPFRMGDHLERLFRSCSEFNLKPPWTQAEIGRMVLDLIRENELDSARVRITLTRGPHTGSMSMPVPVSPTLLITAEAIPEGILEGRAPGVTLAYAKLRFSADMPLARHKTLSRMAHLAARAQAEREGADEALILDDKGNVATCSTGNIFAVYNEQLFTPPLTGPILPGITRKAVLQIAREEGVPIREDFFSPIMLSGASEAFLTNSVRELVPVEEVGGQQIGSGRPGPFLNRFQRLFRELVERV